MRGKTRPYRYHRIRVEHRPNISNDFYAEAYVSAWPINRILAFFRRKYPLAYSWSVDIVEGGK